MADLLTVQQAESSTLIFTTLAWQNTLTSEVEVVPENAP
jgi:hypothetical protein